MSGGALVPLGTGGDLPDPRDLVTQLKAQLTEHVTRIREERGPVTGEEDTYDLISRLTGARERMGEYAAGFTTVATSITGELEIELCEATGDQAGVPNANLTVPDSNGDIRLTREFTNIYNFDVHQIIAVVAAKVADEWVSRCSSAADPNHDPDDCSNGPRVAPEDYAIEVTERYNDLFGAKTPGVRAVRALADELSRAGLYQLAKIVKDAIAKKERFDGVKAARKP